MEIKHSDIIIDKQNPFKNCVLDREKYADILTKVISTYNKSLVLAINSEWGTGKSTFVKMWQQKLEIQQFKTVYFNAWENDFEDEPLTAILGELYSIQDSSKKTFDKVLDIAKNFAIEFVPAAAKGIAKKYISEEAMDIVEGSIKGGGSVVKKLIDKYSEKKKSIKIFREEIEKVIDKISPEKPLIFFIDELDRCRPNYAVSILEKVKHFFNVQNIIFILAIDKEQLGHSVCGVYNSEKINSQEYLRRFIDVEYTIPLDNKSNFIKYLISYYKIDQTIRLNDKNFRTPEEEDFSYLVFNFFKQFSFRKIDKYLSSLRLSLLSIDKKKINPELHLFLFYIKNEKPDFYKKLLRKSFSLKLLDYELNESKNIFENLTRDDINFDFEILLLNSYANYIGPSTMSIFLKENTVETDLIKKRIEALSQKIGKYWLDLNLQSFIERMEITNDFEIN